MLGIEPEVQTDEKPIVQLATEQHRSPKDMQYREPRTCGLRARQSHKDGIHFGSVDASLVLIQLVQPVLNSQTPQSQLDCLTCHLSNVQIQPINHSKDN